MKPLRDMTRGERVRYFRAAKGWDQGELEYHSGVSRSQLSAIENDKARHAHRETIEKLATAFDVSWLLIENGVEMTEGVQYPAFSRGLPDLPPEHAEYIRKLVFQLAAEEASETEE